MREKESACIKILEETKIKNKKFEIYALIHYTQTMTTKI